MPLIYFANKEYTLREGENLLTGLLRQQARIPYSCRAGLCQSCLLTLEQGRTPLNSQQLLNYQQVQKQCFLACQSIVDSDLQISIPARDEIPARVIELNPVTPTEIILILSTRFPLNATSGNLIHILSQPEIQAQLPIQAINTEQNTIEFVVERTVGDNFSRWVHESAQIGDPLLLNVH